MMPRKSPGGAGVPDRALTDGPRGAGRSIRIRDEGAGKAAGMNLDALREAIRHGSGVGAIVHVRTGAAWRSEVLAVEDARVLVMSSGDGDGEGVVLFARGARVRIELPRETSVVCAAGRVAQCRRSGDLFEMEIECPDGAEDRPRRMDVRVDAECLIRLLDGGEWLHRRTVNVSAGGALVADGDPVHPGDLVDVELDLGGETIRCRAEVVRRGVKTKGVTSRTNAAIRFLGLPPVERDRIAVRVLSLQAREKAARHPGHGRAPRPPADDETDEAAEGREEGRRRPSPSSS